MPQSVTMTDERPRLVGYRFSLTCPQCGEPVEEINRTRQGSVSNITIVACTAQRCVRHYDLTLRLTPIRRNG